MAVRQLTNSLSEDNAEEDEDNTLLKVCGTMYKWTNFVYGWQKRYFELENGVLVYYKSESEKQYGSRGSLSLHVARIVEIDIDFNRFNVLTNDTCWYLKTQNPRSRILWLRALRYQISVLMNKMEQLERFNDMIGRQVVRLENLIHVIKDNRDNASATCLLDESIALNAVTIAVLQNISTCIHLYAEQAKVNQNHRCSEQCDITRKVIANNSSQNIMNNQIFKLNNVSNDDGDDDDDDEEKWYDAYDGTPEYKDDRKERCFADNETITMPDFKSLVEIEGTDENCPTIAESPAKIVTLPVSNPFATEINQIAMEQLKYARFGICDDIWQLFMEEDEMKMYKREMEVNGIVCDPVKAVHLVQGVSAREYIHYFFEPRYKQEWDETLVGTRVVNRISMDTVIIHQLHKRVWPSAQRESLFWSNVRYLPEEKSPEALDLYMVCNHDCNLLEVPLQQSSNVRVGLTVAMLCETIIKNGHKKPTNELDRSDIQCQVCYCAQVNPGGWVPVSALRVIYKREYPKFLRGFTKYVLNKIKTQQLVI